MAKFKLVKVQVPVENTNTLLAKISSFDIYEQIIVDPQSPKEQARIQSTKDVLKDRWERVVELSKVLNIQLDVLPSLREDDKELIHNHDEITKSLDAFLQKHEDQIIGKKSEIQKLKKERRILSSLKQFQSEMVDEFSIDLLSSGSKTFTALGEIPSSHEEIIKFYLSEVTAGQIFFWSSSTEDEEKKVILCISLIDYKERIIEILKDNYFDKTVYDLEILKNIEKIRETTKIRELHSEVIKDITRVEGEVESLSLELAENIRYQLTFIRNIYESLTYEERGRTTSKIFTLWGWVTSKEYNNFVNEIKSLNIESKITILEDVPLSRKKERDRDQELLVQKYLDKDEKDIVKHITHPQHKGGGEGFLFAKKALFVRLESPEKTSREFISLIHSLNAVHPVKIGSLNKSVLEIVANQRQELNLYQARINKLSNILKIKESLEQKEKYQIADDYKHSKAFLENFLRENEDKIAVAFSNYEDILKKRDQIKLSLPFEEGLQERGIEAVLLKSGFQTVTYLGVIPESNLKAVRFFLNEVTDNNIIFWDSKPSDSSSNSRNILVLSLKEFDDTILRVLNEYSFQSIDSDMSLVERKVSLKDTLKELEKELRVKDEELQKISDMVKHKLLACKELISAESNRLNTMELSQVSEGKIVLWGWISKQALNQLMQEKDSLSFELEVTENPEVPLVNPAIAKRGKVFGAVRGIVGGIGPPNPKQVDPYSIMRFTFPLLFGLMFADIAHGILLSLIAGFLLYKKKKKKIEPDESITGYLYSGAELLLFCGASSTIFGFFFGSLLGDEHFIPELMHKAGINWIPIINPLEETKLFLIVALFLGFLMIQLGILLKVYQNIRYGHGFASWGAPLSLSIIYVGIFALLYNIIVGEAGIYWSAFNFTVRQVPSWLVFFAGLIPVLLVLEYLHAKSEGIMDAIDHILALISNTLSFSRIMALLLVHAILSGLPFTLTGVDLVAGMSTFSGSFLDVAHIDLSHFGGLIHGHYVSALGISWVWWVVGIVVAIFIILPLEGLLSFLNTLRLHWVEWFTKFYTGDGKEFLPMKEKLVSINFVPKKGS